MKLEKIISGGQTGVDQAGLRAARRLGISTGGWATLGYRTLAGCQEDLLRGFGLVEHLSPRYEDRTGMNVVHSDATIRIASDFNSPGERCTKRALLQHGKPYFNVLVADGKIVQEPRARLALRAFLEQWCVRVLNVAGNSEQTSPGIGAIAEEFLVLALS